MEQFNWTLDSIFKNAQIDISDEDYKKLLDGFEELDQKVQDRQITINDIDDNTMQGELLKPYILSKKQGTIKSFLEYIEKMLDPQDNGFEIVKYRNLNVSNYPKREIWFDSESVLMKESQTYKVKL